MTAAVRNRLILLTAAVRNRLILLTAVGLAIRVAFVLGFRRFDVVGGDSYWYHAGANLLADGEGFVHPFRLLEGVRQPGADHPPAYLIALSLPSVLGLRSILAHQLTSCVLGAAAVPFMGLAGERLGGLRVATAAAAIAALSPLFWVNDALLLAESLAITLVAAAIWLALRGSVVAAGAVLGALALTRAEAVLLVPLVLVPVAWKRRRQLAAAVAAAALVMAPWCIANLIRFERPTLLSTQFGITLAHANCDATYHGPFLGWWDFQCVDAFDDPPGDRSVADAFHRERALRYMGDHFGRVPVVVLARIGREWGLYDPAGQARFDELEGRPHAVNVAGTVVLYATVVAAAIGVRRLRGAGGWTWAALAPLWAPILVVTLSAAAFYGTTRFRAVAEPSLALLAAVALAPAPNRDA